MVMDHIGAIPYVLREINVPIYSTKLTNGLIEHKLREHNMLTKVKRKVVKHGQHINLDVFVWSLSRQTIFQILPRRSRIFFSGGYRGSYRRL